MRFVGRPTFKCTWDGSGKFRDYLGLDQTTYEAVKLAYRQGGFKRFSPAYEPELILLWDSQSLCAAQGMSFELWMTTTRPYNRLDSTDPDTRFWLERQQISFDHLLYDEHKYTKLAEIVGPDRVVFVAEDLPEYVEEAYEAFPEAMIYMPERKHNEAWRKMWDPSVVAMDKEGAEAWANAVWNPFYSMTVQQIEQRVFAWYKEHEEHDHE